MTTKAKEPVSAVSSHHSSTGNEISKTKSSSGRGILVRECQDTPCDGIQSLRVLQNYLTANNKSAGAAPTSEKAPEDRKEPDDRKEPEDGEAPENGKAPTPQVSEPELSQSDTNVTRGKKLKRKPKPPRTNPYWDGGWHPDHPLLPIPRPPRTVEIHGGDVLGQCECLKRNGLQHECPKSDCRGDSLCLTWPIPTCQPSGLGVPIIVESRVMRPDEPVCELTAEQKKNAEKAAVVEKRKEEVRLVEYARANWKLGKDQAALQKAANQKKGYLKCSIHSGKYRLVPLMRDEITQTPDAMCVCPCEEAEHLPPPAADTRSQPQLQTQPQPERPPGDGKETSKTQAPATSTEKLKMESVRTSTTGIPRVGKLKALMKK